jgi:hypothetical protein
LTARVELEAADARTSRKHRILRLADAGALANSILAGAGGANLVAATVIPAHALLSIVAILALFGALIGASIGSLQAVLRQIGFRGRVAIWIGLGCLASILVVKKLGAFDKLDGPYAKLSLATIAAGFIGGVALGSSLSALHPGPDGRSLLARLPVRWRWVFVACSLLVGAALVIYETTAFWLYTYPAARQMLNVVAILCGYSALLVLLQSVSWSARRALVRRVAVFAVLGASAISGLWARDVNTVVSLGPLEHAISALRWSTDWDRDGASGLFGGGDCAPHDRAIYPTAKEIPGNGIDENCQFGDAKPRRLSATSSAGRPAQPSPVNFVIITVDSLRPDHTSAYGYSRDTTPNLARFARGALRFDSAYTSGGWTCLALPSTFSGVRVRRLDWEPIGLTKALELIPVGPDRQLPSDHEANWMLTYPKSAKRWTLQAALRERGIRTAAVLSRNIAHFASFIGEGWDAIDVSSTGMDKSVTPLAVNRLASFGASPGFLWIHYFNPHHPQQRHENGTQFGDSIRDRYDHEVAATDYEIGKLLEAVDAHPGRPTVVLVASDHGEGIDDTRQWHGTDLFEDSIRILMLLRVPGGKTGTVTTPVSLVDIAPTVLALTQTPSPPDLDGEDLQRVAQDRIVFTDLFRINLSGSVYMDQVAATGLGYRLTYDRIRNTMALTRMGDPAQPPVELDPEVTPSALREGLGAYMELASDFER